MTMGLGFLLNPKYFKDAFEDMMKSSSFIVFGGALALVVGFLIVHYHNFWVSDWTVIITIIGWGGLIKGVVLFLAPKAMIKFSRVFLGKKNMHLMGVGALIFGLVLGYFGFFA